MPGKRYIHEGCASFAFPCDLTVPTVHDFLDILQRHMPRRLAEDWDNVGLLVGDPGQDIRSVLVALDPALPLLDQARASGHNCILTHHPAIFHPLKALRTDTPIGAFIAGAARHDISVIACHTNLDAVRGGVSDVLAAALGLDRVQPLVAAGDCDPGCGLGRIGVLAEAVTAAEFLARLRQACAPPWILEAGPRPERVGRVAVCGGSCGDFAETALALGADVFVTAEVKHSVARWAEDAGLWLLDAGHFATEYPAMRVLSDLLRRHCADQGWPLAIDTAEQHPPLRLA